MRTAVIRVLVTHADEPIGRGVVKRLARDPRVHAIFAVGSGPTPRAFDALLAGDGPPAHYARAVLSRHRGASDLFHAQRFREAEIDTIVHLPPHAREREPTSSPWAGLTEITAETRLVVQHALEVRSVRNLVALGSAYVYRLHPGNANRLTEDSELDLDPRVAPEIRAWIDADMIVHGEVHSERLRVVLLRAPTVVGKRGDLFLSPLLHPERPLARATGFDPLCPVISHQDVLRAIEAAVFAQKSGIYNVSGREVLPLSELVRAAGRSAWSLPHPLLGAWGAGARLFGAGWRRLPYQGPALRYGFSLDTRRAERELGFRPADRIGAAPAADGAPRLEATSGG